MWLIELTIFFVLVTFPCLSEAWKPHQINATKYFRMPMLYKTDDFDGCMEVYDREARYCFVKTYIKPDPSSEQYNDIAEFSSKYKQHFRHDKLTRGICINSCKNIINQLGDPAEKYFVPEFPMDSKLIYEFVNYVNAVDDRKKYNHLINQCINIELMDNYGLKGFSSIEYCTQNEIQTGIDWLDISFIFCFVILLMVVFASSSYDKRLHQRQTKEFPFRSILIIDHFKKLPESISDRLLVSFSLSRNWYLLTAPTHSDMRDIRSISAIRIWSMISLIYGHCIMIAGAMPLQNPYYLEKSYHQIPSMIVINGGNLVQTFFFISGFMNSTVLLKHVETNGKHFLLWIKTVVYRFIRFAPVLTFLAFLHATWLYRFDYGPFWDKIVFAERQACRTNFWTNILFINNYVSGDLKCMVHTWFIASDFHMSAVGTAILLVVVNKPKYRSFILPGMIATSFAISFVVFYVKRLEPIMMLAPESLRNHFYVTTELDSYFYDFHVPAHLNSGNYLIGIFFGYTYYEFKKSGGKHYHKTWLQVLWHLSYLSTFFLSLIGIYFYENDIEKGFVSAILGAIFKHIYGPAIGITIVGIFLRYGHSMPKIFNYGMYRLNFMVVMLMLIRFHKELFDGVRYLIWFLARFIFRMNEPYLSKMKLLILLFTFAINSKTVNCLNSKFNVSQYYLMPSLYNYDDYDGCSALFDDPVYCIIDIQIKPELTSDLYNYITKFSNNYKQHFRHDKLERGLCINLCKQHVEKLESESFEYQIDSSSINAKETNDEFNIYFNAYEDRKKYDELVNKCINIELIAQFNLSGFSSIEYCITKNGVPLDQLDFTAAFVCLALILIGISSSLYDRYLRNTISSNNEAHHHYKTTPSSLVHKVLTSFSLRRSWCILSAHTKPEVRELRFIQALRALTLFGVIIGHCGWLLMLLPSNNPIFIENIYSNIESMLVVNGANIVQSFFVISGFLIAVLFENHVSHAKNANWSLLVKAFVLRYIRFAPLIFLTMLIHATWLYRFGSGPFWDKVTFAERQYCRNNWWTNVLFLDNYINVDEKCLIHSWYLAVDFWLSFIATAVLIAIKKFPQFSNSIIIAFIGFSAIATGFTTYINNFEPLAIFSPEFLRNFPPQDGNQQVNYYRTFYVPTHLNIGNYFIGMAFGLKYVELKKSNRTIKKSLFFKVLWFLCIPTGFATCLSAYIFYAYEFKKPAIWIAFVSAILKHSWGFVMGVMLLGIIYNYGWFIPNVFNYPLWRILGRISFSSFICHMFVLKLLMANVRQPLYLSVSNVMPIAIAIYILSNLIGLVLALIIEVPISSLTKMIIRKSSNTESNTETHLTKF